MSCYRGLYSVNRRQLNDFADGKLRTINCAGYGKTDGMLSSDGNGRGCARGRDARVSLGQAQTAGCAMLFQRSLGT